jgi:Fe-S oxidoreductase
VKRDSQTALLLGCRYARVHPQEARAAIRLARELAGPVRLLDGCCGAWQRSAGAASAGDGARARLTRELESAKRLLVLDPRCALELEELAPMTLVELASRHLERFGPGREPEIALRYHDSCALGRGLGLYDEPRALLTHLAGRAPLELENQRELSRCSGGGGILPVSMPEVASSAAARLLHEHQDLGGGMLVTSCASSLSQMRRSGAAVVDLVTLLADGLKSDD